MFTGLDGARDYKVTAKLGSKFLLSI